MDEIWVPTEAAKKAFLVGGAPLNKLTVVPEPVDTYFYSNRISQDSEIDNSSKKRTIFKTMTQWQLSPSHPPIVSSETFVFLFVGKFEYRKGIHLLLKAFYEEFFSHLNNEEDLEDVLLCILTSAYHSTSDFFGEVERFLLEEQIVQSVPLETFLSKIILYTDVPQIQMPLLYSTANVLVSINFICINLSLDALLFLFFKHTYSLINCCFFFLFLLTTTLGHPFSRGRMGATPRGGHGLRDAHHCYKLEWADSVPHREQWFPSEIW